MKKYIILILSSFSNRYIELVILMYLSEIVGQNCNKFRAILYK